MDRPQDHQADHDAPGMPSESQLRAAIEESDRDVAAGRTVPLADVLAELDGIANRLEVRRRARRV
jgi:hypothetical protein